MSEISFKFFNREEKSMRIDTKKIFSISKISEYSTLIHFLNDQGGTESVACDHSVHEICRKMLEADFHEKINPNKEFKIAIALLDTEKPDRKERIFINNIEELRISNPHCEGARIILIGKNFSCEHIVKHEYEGDKK